MLRHCRTISSFLLISIGFQSVAAFQSFHPPLAKKSSQSFDSAKVVIQERSNENAPLSERRSFLSSLSTISISLISSALVSGPTLPALGDDGRMSLDKSIYTILRVREATTQESRLITSGKFKDVQRANVKLAIKSMVVNYRLNDNFIAASSYLEGNRQIEAGNAGLQAVQQMYTILEYFDSADVQNIKVGAADMKGKEKIVLQGLDAVRISIDKFLAYFPVETVESAKELIASENSLNEKEFDNRLGSILNLNPFVSQKD